MEKQNSVVVLLGRVHGASVVPCCVEMTIRCYNTVDMLSKEGRSHYADNIKGYLPRSDLEAILENLRSHLQTCYSIKNAVVLKEEEADA
jgi:hypothetical protein